MAEDLELPVPPPSGRKLSILGYLQNDGGKSTLFRRIFPSKLHFHPSGMSNLKMQLWSLSNINEMEDCNKLIFAGNKLRTWSIFYPFPLVPVESLLFSTCFRVYCGAMFGHLFKIWILVYTSSYASYWAMAFNFLGNLFSWDKWRTCTPIVTCIDLWPCKSVSLRDSKIFSLILMFKTLLAGANSRDLNGVGVHMPWNGDGTPCWIYFRTSLGHLPSTIQARAIELYRNRVLNYS